MDIGKFSYFLISDLYIFIDLVDIDYLFLVISSRQIIDCFLDSFIEVCFWLFRQNAEVFRTKTGAFRSAMKKHADFGMYNMVESNGC